MQNSVVEYLEQAARLWPKKAVYRDEKEEISFAGALDECRRVGTTLCKITEAGRPVILLSAKSVHVAPAYLGIAAAGCFYVPLDVELPEFRLKLIFELVQAQVVLTDGSVKLPESLGYTGQVITMEECLITEPDFDMLQKRRLKQKDTDPLYVIFTSGSGGVPKGVVGSHGNVISYIDAFAETFPLEKTDSLGNQAPLDYVAALRDLYLPLRTGAETVLLPKSLFSQPVKLFETINKYKITILCWVASALSLCAGVGAFKEVSIPSVRRVFFTGSVLPSRHLRIWQENLPDVMFINHYGPTEITASCTYYIVDHIVSDDESIPIGVPFPNAKIFLLDDENDNKAKYAEEKQNKEKHDGEKQNKEKQKVPEEEIGEICVGGRGVALGYFQDPKKTKDAFIPATMFASTTPDSTFASGVGFADTNIDTHTYTEGLIYKTGDLGKKRSDGNYMFCGRKDSQIKHMGHRIEPGEIEVAAMSLSGIKETYCLYHQEKEVLCLFYTGTAGKKELATHLRKRLPGFMVPRKFIQIKEFPLNQGGKIDFNALQDVLFYDNMKMFRAGQNNKK